MSIAVVTKEPVDIYRYTSGQEYYLYTLAKVLPRSGLRISFLTIDQLLTDIRDCNEYSSFHSYYLSFRDVVRLRKIVKDSRLVYHVYHVEDVTWTKTRELSWKAFLVSLRPLVDMYLATARSVYSWLKCRVPQANCMLVEPYYECSCNSFHRLAHIVAEKFSSKEIKLLYIGRLSRYRSPPSTLLAIAKSIALRTRKHIELTIVSKITSKKKSVKYDSGDVVLHLIDDRIDDNEKCELYRESHFFIYLSRGNVAMNPPITLLESVYHGAIPIVSSWILRDIEVPSRLVADNVAEAINRIISLWTSSEHLDKVVKRLEESFKGFYDVYRFIKAIKCTL